MKKDMLKEAEKGSKGKFKMFDIKNGIIITIFTRIQNQMVENEYEYVVRAGTSHCMIGVTISWKSKRDL